MHNKETIGFLKSFLGDLFDPGLDEAEISQIIENLSNHMPEIVNQSAAILTASLQRSSRAMLRRQRRDLRGFRRRHSRLWQPALDALETCCKLATEAGQIFVDKHKVSAGETLDYQFQALSRLHARACQVAAEVVELLRGGFADGANARWRTLHEIAVISLFLTESGCDVAQRYTEYRAVQAYRDAATFQEKAQVLGYDPYSEDEMRSIKSERDRLVECYGDPFGKPYGWAASELKDANPTFVKVEASVGLSHHRPYFRMANQSVHSGPEALEFQLGNPKSHVLLVGPSNYGLADPGQSTAISIHQVAGALLLTKMGFEELVTLQVINGYVDEVMSCFTKVNAEVQED